MSERAIRRGIALMLLGCCVAVTSATLPAQSAVVDSLERERAGVSARARAVDQERRRLSSNSAQPAETVHVDGIPSRLIIQPAGIPRQELAMITGGMRAAQTTLERRFGASSARLSDAETWYVVRGFSRARFVQPMSVQVGRGNNFTQWSFPRPFSQADFERFALRRAGDRLAFRAPVIRAYAGTGISLATSDDRFADAARELRMSAAAPLRRCSMGSVADCRRTLAAAEGQAGLGIWYDSTEMAVAISFAKFDFQFSDTLRWNQRKRCVDGNDRECALLARAATINPPYSDLVRITFVEHALDVAPQGMLDTLLAADGGDPLELLSRGTGLSVDSLVAGWQRRLVAALDADQVSAIPTALSTALWSLLLLGFATRRRGSA